MHLLTQRCGLQHWIMLSVLVKDGDLNGMPVDQVHTGCARHDSF